MSDKVLFYKNLNRVNKNKAHSKYTPHYKSLNIEPHQFSSIEGEDISAISDDGLKKQGEPANRRGTNLSINENMFNSTMPPSVAQNNDVKETIIKSSPHIIDDISNLNLDRPMIDNNDFINTDEMHNMNNNFSVEASDVDENDINDPINIIYSLDNDSYLLLVKGKIICSGDKKIIENYAFDIILGNAENFKDENIVESDIAVVKKVDVKIGVQFS